MKSFFKICAWIIAMVNSIASIILIFIICPRVIHHENLGFDYIGVIVAVLALLVTLLVGWQIYSTMEAKEKIEKITSDFEKKVTDNEESTNNVKAMVFSVCGDLLDIQFNNSLQAYEYYLYALRNYLFGRNKQSSVDRTLAKMDASLSEAKGEDKFQNIEMFYSILQEIKSSGKLNEKQFELLESMEDKRKELTN